MVPALEVALHIPPEYEMEEGITNLLARIRASPGTSRGWPWVTGVRDGT